MGPTKKDKVPSKKSVCATESLHQGPKTQTQLVHRSSVRAATTIELLGMVGRSAKRFAGKFCIDCIQMVSPEEALRLRYVPRPSTSKVQTPVNEDSCPNDYAMGMDIDMDLQTEHSTCTEDTQSTVANVGPNSDIVIVLSLNNLRKDLEALSPDIRALIAFELAASEKANIRSDALHLTRGEFRDIDSLSNICNTDYLLARNPVLVNFITGLSSRKQIERTEPSTETSKNLPVPIDKQSDIYKIAKAIESCMGLTTPVSVLPFHFREIVLLYSFTKSRNAVALMSCTAPHGSYQTIRNWLDKLAKNECDLQLPTEKGDTVCAFDNNQVLQRRWNISVNNRALCSVITMVIFVDIDPEGTLQFQEELKPSNWMWSNLDASKKATLMEGHRNAVHQDTRYRKHFHPWLTGIILEVAYEQLLVAGKCQDDIDKQVKANQYAKQYRTCPKCGSTEIPKAKRKCPSCDKWMTTSEPTGLVDKEHKSETKSVKKGDVRVLLDRKDDTTYDMKFERCNRKAGEYDHLPQHHPKEPPKVKVGQPIFVNPCSYQSVAEVFRQIGKQAGIKKYGGKREWITVVCDGLPYVIGYQLIERSFECRLCGASVSGLDERNSHRTEHNDVCTFTKEFDWLIIQPGPGHIEMNMLKTFVKFSWPIFWEGMVEVFNFRSELAKKSAHNVNDHHKGMTLGRIARDSFAKELVLPYVRQELLKDEGQLSVAGYLKFAMNTAVSRNYGLMFELTFSILDAIFLYRAGLRCGDTDMIDAGRAFFARMWCSRPHPLYRQLALYDSIVSACMPPVVHNFVQRTKSINLSGIPNSAEGVDFKLEAMNKQIQHWMPPVPTDKDWKNACANHPALSRLRRTALTEMGLKDPKDRSSRASSDITEQVTAFRTALREREFVGHHNLPGPLTSYDKLPLDEDLEKFANKAAAKEAIFLKNFFNHNEIGGFKKKQTVPFKEPPIFVTPQERAQYEDIRNKSISQCTDIIHMKIDEIDDEDMRNNFAEAFERDIKGKKKQTHIEFLELIVEYQSMENTVANPQHDAETDNSSTQNEHSNTLDNEPSIE